MWDDRRVWVIGLSPRSSMDAICENIMNEEYKLRQIHVKETKGKIVRGMMISSHCPTSMVIVFEDGTFSNIKAENEYEEGIQISDSSIDIRDYDSKETVLLGIATKEDYENLQKETNLREKMLRRAQYEMLKKQFENEEPQS